MSVFSTSEDVSTSRLREVDTKIFSKSAIEKILKDNSDYLFKNYGSKSKLLLKLFSNENILKTFGDNSDYYVEVGAINCDPFDYIAVMESNVLKKTVLSISLVTNEILKSFPEFQKKLEEIRKESKGSEVEFLKNTMNLTKEFNKKIVDNVVHKNVIRMYCYPVEMNHETGSAKIKSTNTFLDFNTCINSFLSKDPESGSYLTDTMLVTNGKISKKDYDSKWIKKAALYETWVKKNWNDDNTFKNVNALIIHVKIKFNETLKNILSNDGELIDDFVEDANIVLFVGKESEENTFFRNYNTIFGNPIIKNDILNEKIKKALNSSDNFEEFKSKMLDIL